MIRCWIDTETYSPVPIDHGIGAYAPASEVMLITWAVEDEPVQWWDVTRTRSIPRDLAERFDDPETIFIAHNAPFDRRVLQFQDWFAALFDVPIERWRCTMAQAYAHGLPGSLGKLGEIFGLETQKRDGKALINLFCKPRPKNMKLRRATRETHPDEWEKFIEYAIDDTAALRELSRKLPTWNYPDNPRELGLWFLDQTINDRGVFVDLAHANAALAATEQAKRELKKISAELTDGYVESATQRDKMLVYLLAEHGVSLPDMQAATLEKRLEDPELPEAVKELIRVRLAATTASTAKYQRAINGANEDGRIRGLLQFCGAQRTGRWAGRTLQPQNFPRPKMSAEEIEEGIRAMKGGYAHLVYDNVMELASYALRGIIIAPRGRKLVVSDLSNIEGRVLPWLGDESWKLQAFREYDAGIGPDMYKLAYSRPFRLDPSEVSSFQRQMGKGMELSMGYEGGVGAFLNIAAAYKLDLDEMTEAAWDTLPNDVRDRAERAWEWAVEQRKTFGLRPEVYIVCDALKRMWRSAHPKLSTKCWDCDEPCEHAGLWQNYEKAFRSAILHPGKVYSTGRCQFACIGQWLRIRLPSGRELCYPQPRVNPESGELSYMGINQYTKRWQRIKTYSGKITENIDQAVSRDVLAHAMPLAEAAGYQIILTVHDELVTETPDSDAFSADALSEILATNPPWAAGLPLAAGGFEGYRYRKD